MSKNSVTAQLTYLAGGPQAKSMLPSPSSSSKPRLGGSGWHSGSVMSPVRSAHLRRSPLGYAKEQMLSTYVDTAEPSTYVDSYLPAIVDSARLSTIADTLEVAMPDIGTLITDWNKLGALVKDARNGYGWSQTELAQRANVSRAWIAKLEAGHRGAELEQILRLFQALQMNLIARPVGVSTDNATGALAPEQSVSDWTTGSLAAHRAANERRRDAWARARQLTPDGSGVRSSR